MKIISNGIGIHVEEQGSGDPALVFLHYGREQVIADSLLGALQAREAWVRQTGQEDISAAVAAIAVPTLAIYGELDRVHTAEAAKSDLIPLIPGAVLQTLPGTGHLSPLESPSELVRLIGKFAAGLSR